MTLFKKKKADTDPGADEAVTDVVADAAPDAPAVDADAPPLAPALIEGVNGGDAYELDGSAVEVGDRHFSHHGVHYEHVSEDAAGRWVYRAQ